MNVRRIAYGCMLAGGIIDIVIAVVHFFWPHALVNYAQFRGLTTDFRNMVVLSAFAIGVCLTVFGLLSIYFSRRLLAGERSAWVFGISQGVLWAARAALEVAYPVGIPLFFITRPTIFVLPLAILLGLIYLVPLLAIRREFWPKGRDKK
jgi:hypothetical protein